MRISVLRSDPGYTEYATFAIVTLNDKPLRSCITADERLAEATVHCYDEMGRLMGLKTMYGRVRISFPKHPALEQKLRRP